MPYLPCTGKHHSSLDISQYTVNSVCIFRGHIKVTKALNITAERIGPYMDGLWIRLGVVQVVSEYLANCAYRAADG